MNTKKLNNSRYLLHLLAVILPLVTFWALYHDALDGWWKWDDFCDLEYENRQALGEPFLEKQTAAIYAPVHRFSRQIDFLLFGLNPTAFYWHQLISFTVALAFLYGMLCLFFSPILASIIVSLIVVSEPTTEIAYFLMLRHYPEELILALASILCYLLAVTRQKFAWAMVGSLFYLLASSNIANYPLVGILVFLPVGKLKNRIYMLIPFIGIAIFYVFLRAYMLGEQNLLAVSGHLAMPSALAVLKFPAVFFSTTMGWQTFWQWLPLLVAISGFSIALYKKPFSLGIASLAWFGATLVPLIPTLYRPDGLYYNHFNLVLLLYLGYGVAFKQLTELLPSTILRNMLLVLLLIVSFFANLPAVHREQVVLQEIDTQSRAVGEFFLSANFSSNATLMYGHHCGSGLVYVRKKILGQKIANWCPVDSCACTALYPNTTGYWYEGKQWVTRTLLPCGVAKPLTASFKLTSANTLAWQLSPYTQGVYSFHLSNSDLFDFHWGQASAWVWFLPPALQGTYTSPRPIVAPVTITVRYASPEGWETFSPPLTLDPNGHLEVTWENH